MADQKEPLHTSQPDDIRQDLGQMRESVELARSDIRRAKNDIAQYQSEHASHVRRTRALWVLVILLVAGAAGLWWYGSPRLSEHQSLLSQVPALQSNLDNVNTRVDSTQQQVSGWATDRAGFSERMSRIEKSVASNLQTVRNEARLMAQQIKAGTEQSLKTLQNRVTGIESIQREHGEEVAGLRNELAGVRQELVGVREENARQTTQISRIDQAHQSTRNDVSGLDRRLGSNQTAVNALANQVERKRVDFEVHNGRTQQVVDGIYLTVKDTDVGRQRVDGWVQIAGDGRFVWLRGEGAQNPVSFSSRTDARPYQLVFTRIERDSTAGYLLVPITSGATAALSN